MGIVASAGVSACAPIDRLYDKALACMQAMRRVAVAHAGWEAYNTALTALADAFRTSPIRMDFWARVMEEGGVGLPVHADEVEGATMSHEQALQWVQDHAPAARAGPSGQVLHNVVVEDDELADMG